MKFKLCISIISSVLLFSPLTAKELSITKQIEFSKPTKAKTVVGLVKGFDSKKYEVKVNAQQSLSVDLDSDMVCFNIYSPYKKREDGALFRGKSQGKHFKADGLKEGVYIIRVYLRTKEAEEDTKRIFEMRVGLK